MSRYDQVAGALRPNDGENEQEEARMGDEIRAYIGQFDGPVRDELGRVYEAMRAALPDEPGRMSWGMPTFGKNVIHFAAAKRHVGVYPGPEAVEHFGSVLLRVGRIWARGHSRKGKRVWCG